MLKARLTKLYLICFSLFLLAANVSSHSNLPVHDSAMREALTAATAVKSTNNSRHLFDSSGLCTCLSSPDAGMLANAPRITLNAKARKFVKEYLKKNNPGLEKIRARSEDYFSMMDRIFCQYDLPQELKYLSVVESRLKQRAVSHAGAAGLWQLMPSTAKQMGLKITRKYDERMLRNKSTHAAAKYLTYLHDEFGDWLLAVAAYNSGPGGVYKAIRLSGSRDFWVLQRFLPAETRDYVKKYISIHYYFENRAGITTLTKYEMNKHIKAVAAFNEKIREAAEEQRILELVRSQPDSTNNVVFNSGQVSK